MKLSDKLINQLTVEDYMALCDLEEKALYPERLVKVKKAGDTISIGDGKTAILVMSGENMGIIGGDQIVWYRDFECFIDGDVDDFKNATGRGIALNKQPALKGNFFWAEVISR